MPNDGNILMGVEEKYPGITHVSFKVASMDATRGFLEESRIPLSGQFSFKGMQAVFIRDPDRNVIELDIGNLAAPVEQRDGASYKAILTSPPAGSTMRWKAASSRCRSASSVLGV